MMRLTGGAARGRLVSCPDQPGVRPTSARVREALFSVIGQDLRGLRVADAFGGSGLLGLEAWSRGAEVVVVERDPRVAKQIEATGKQLAVPWRVVRGDATAEIPRMEPFEGILLDPPYSSAPVPILDALAPRARRWLVLETEAGVDVPERCGGLVRDRVRSFGRTFLHVFWREDTEVHGDVGPGEGG